HGRRVWIRGLDSGECGGRFWRNSTVAIRCTAGGCRVLLDERYSAAARTDHEHDPLDRGASDTTPLFLFGLALYRKSANEPEFLDGAAQKALKWMQYQSPDDMVMISQLPTSDWRDEQWVMGYGLYVNTLVYAYLLLYGEHESACELRELMNRLEVLGEAKNPHEHEGLVMPSKPYYALYSYKVMNSDRFDLLGNSLTILTGIASPHRARNLVAWIEAECEA